VASSLGQCHGEKTHFSKNKKGTKEHNYLPYSHAVYPNRMGVFFCVEVQPEENRSTDEPLLNRPCINASSLA
jgi:hypothetical protein